MQIVEIHCAYPTVAYRVAQQIAAAFEFIEPRKKAILLDYVVERVLPEPYPGLTNMPLPPPIVHQTALFAKELRDRHNWHQQSKQPDYLIVVGGLTAIGPAVGKLVGVSLPLQAHLMEVLIKAYPPAYGLFVFCKPEQEHEAIRASHHCEWEMAQQNWPYWNIPKGLAVHLNERVDDTYNTQLREREIYHAVFGQDLVHAAERPATNCVGMNFTEWLRKQPTDICEIVTPGGIVVPGNTNAAATEQYARQMRAKFPYALQPWEADSAGTQTVGGLMPAARFEVYPELEKPQS